MEYILTLTKPCSALTHAGGITDCYDAMTKGATHSGMYIVQQINANNSFNVYCDMETDEGGWTVLLKRQDGSVDFYRNWTDYKSGFGNLEGEHWLGLDNMYLLTHQSSDPPQLRVDLADWEGNTAFAKYDRYSVGAEDSDYTLSESGYQSASTAGDSLKTFNGYHNGQRFSTPDRDNDVWSYNCAVYYHGPWWHKACYYTLLTGKYYTSGGTWPIPHGMIWYQWKGDYFSLRVAELKIRPGGV